MTSVPLPRKWTVSRTLPSSASRNSCASSSRPVASGTRCACRPVDVRGGLAALFQRGALLRAFLDRHELLGADGAVALAPALVRAGDDLLAQLEDPVHERL